MSANKETIEKYMQGFREIDHQKILSCLTDDVIWEMPGTFKHVGKEAFDSEIENDNFEGSPSIQVFRLVEENDVVIAEGAVQCKMKNGDMLNLVFCDVFQMKNAKIKQLTSYLMTK